MTGKGEEKWLLLYAIASFVYRSLVSVGIALFLASRLFFIGTAMAIWAIGSLVIVPLYKGLMFLMRDRRLDGQRRRGFAVIGGLVVAVACILFLLPLPYATVAEGVVWIPDHAEVRAATSGFVDKILVAAGTRVEPSTPLIAMTDPVVQSQVAVRKAQIAELRERLNAARLNDRVQAEILNEQIGHLKSSLALIEAHSADLTVRSDGAGRFVPVREEDMPGRFVKKGELLGYVVSRGDPTIRTIVAQSDVDLVRQRTDRVAVRFVDDLGKVYDAHIAREVPGAGQEVPSLALTTQGGGSIAVDPNAKSPKPQALFGLFQVDVRLDAPIPNDYPGERVYVRFDYGTEPIAWRVARAFRGAFLNHFHV